MKITRVLNTLALSAFCTGTLATVPPSLSTFGTNGIAEYTSNGESNTAHNVKASVSSFNSPFGVDFRSNMKVSNYGDVVFVDETTKNATIWKLSNNSYQYNLGNNGNIGAIDITTKGDKALVGGSIWISDKISQSYQPSNFLTASLAMSSDGRLGTYGTVGAGTNGNTIASYPAFDTLDTPGLVFESPFIHSALDPVINTKKGLIPETLNRGLYEEVNLIDVSGDSNIMLSTLRHGYIPDSPPVPGENYFLNSYNFDITLMDTGGRYVSEPYNVRYPVSLSNSGKVVLAYKEIEGCPIIDEITQENCAILWQSNNQVIKLGNFLPFAMSGDASMVVGRSHDDENRNAIAVYWDKERGARTFVSAMAEVGLDLSGWTDIYPLDIAKDNSKIVGHGINPQGLREGFLIDWPQKELEKWQRYEIEDTPVFLENNWIENTEVTDTVVKQSHESAARVSYKFDGSRVRIIGTKGLENGFFNIYIDNIYWGSFDTFDCSQTYSDLIFESDYLGEGEHQLVIEVAHRKQLASLNTYIGIDRFEVESYSPQDNSQDTPDTSNFSKYDISFNRLNQTDPNTPMCFGLFGCWERGYQSYHHLWADSEVSTPISDVIGEDGSFSVETWMRSVSVGSNLLNISHQGKYFNVAVTTGGKLNWTGNEGLEIPFSTRFTDWATEDTKYIHSTHLSHARSKSNITWNHLIVSGNWNTGQIEVYFNGSLVGQPAVLEISSAQDNLIRLARPLTPSSNLSSTGGFFAKFSVYGQSFSSEDAKNRFDWPTHYGLKFAPNASHEFSSRLPGCSTGCEPGQIVYSLSGNANGTGIAYSPVGGF